jgi:23S rRNA A1618 N6-methylase RlmF
MYQGKNGRRSKKSLQAALAPIGTNSELDRKITLATECFTTTKASELILKDRARLSEENALTICNYIIAFKREVNPRPSYIKYTIQSLSELSRAVGIEKRFEDYTKDGVLSRFRRSSLYVATGLQAEGARCTN